MTPSLQYAPTTLRYVLITLGLYKACELVSNVKTWAVSWLPSGTAPDATVNKTIVAANSTLNGAGFWGSLWGSLWSGLSENPVSQTVSIAVAPIRAGFCFATESGFSNKAGCVFGLDENGKNDLEEKVQTICVIVLLVGCWYLTNHKKKEKKHEDKLS